MEELSQILWAAVACVGAISSVTVAVTNVVNHLTGATGFWQQFTSWVIAILFTGIAHLSGLVPNIDPMWVTILVTGLINGLVSNGIYDIPVITEWMEKWFPKKISENTDYEG